MSEIIKASHSGHDDCFCYNEDYVMLKLNFFLFNQRQPDRLGQLENIKSGFIFK